MKTPAPKSLDTKREMLKTLKLAYQGVLDQVSQYPGIKPRLSNKQARDLGRRLATYWSM